MAGETTIKTIAIAAILLTLMAVSGVSIVSIIASSSGSQINESRMLNFNSSFNKLIEINESITELSDTVTAPEDTNPIFNLFDTIFNKASSIMRTIQDSFTFMNDYFEGLTITLGVPKWVVTILGLLLTVVIVFSFLRLIFQREP